MRVLVCARFKTSGRREPARDTSADKPAKPAPSERDKKRPDDTSTRDWSSETDQDSRLVSLTAEDLLKQRYLHAQKRSPENTLMTGGSGSAHDMSSFFRRSASEEDKEDRARKPRKSEPSSATTSFQKPDETSLMGMPPPETSSSSPHGPSRDGAPSDSAAHTTAEAAVSSETKPDNGAQWPLLPQPGLSPMGRTHVHMLPDQPFDAHVFVRRLEEGGWAPAAGASRRHDPAEALMDLTRTLLKQRADTLVDKHIVRGDLDNQLYLFSSALSELRTEVRVRARNDAAALRSITLLLQREIDGLKQKLQADIERLKHDIQVDMNNRKTEVQEESNNLELEIQDLNNRFTIFLSDLKTEIEQNIKWDATRRALALVFGITAIVVCALALADYFTRPENLASGSDATAAADDNAEASATRAQRALLPVDHTLEEIAVPSAPPKSAEEWGLLPRYDSDEVRYV